MRKHCNRRSFLAATTAAGVGLSVATVQAADDDKPAILGGAKAHTKGFPSWPQLSGKEDQPVIDVLHSGQWCRGGAKQVSRFEEAFARLYGAKHCVATNSGTGALICSLGALGIGPGDEVIVSPYTFVASVTAIMMHHALPVFVDTDPETFQIDARKIEAAITERTAALLPVHIGGSPANLDAILEIGARRKLPVVEDACQTILGKWRDKTVGTLGATGCISFQMSKNMCSGDGGAILVNDDDLAQRCYAFHNNCRGKQIAGYNFSYVGRRAGNFRMTEFQGVLLQSQLARVEEQSVLRNENATYLSSMLREIPGIAPAKLHEGCNRSGYHLYMFRYDAERFSGLPRAKFLAALGAEGVPCSGGYSPLNKEAFLAEAFKSRGYQRCFPKQVLDGWCEANRCPANDKLCTEAVWFYQTLLLGTRTDMEQIAQAIRKIQKHSAQLAKR